MGFFSQRRKEERNEILRGRGQGRFGLLHREGFLGLKGTQGQELPQDLSRVESRCPLRLPQSTPHPLPSFLGPATCPSHQPSVSSREILLK